MNRISRTNISFEPVEIDDVFKVMLNLKESGKFFLSEFSRVSEKFDRISKFSAMRSDNYPISGQYVFKKGPDLAIDFSSLEEALLVTSLIETLYRLDNFRTNIIKVDMNTSNFVPNVAPPVEIP